MKNTYVHYVDNSTPTLKKFKSLEAAQKFVIKFKKASPNPSDGYWVDFIVVGEFIMVDEYYEKMV